MIIIYSVDMLSRCLWNFDRPKLFQLILPRFQSFTHVAFVNKQLSLGNQSQPITPFVNSLSSLKVMCKLF